MNTTLKKGTVAVAVILVFLCALGAALHAQTNSEIITDNPLQPVAFGDIPGAGTFFRLSDYVTYEGSLGPPWPFLMDTNAAVYALNGNAFLVDDVSLTNDNDALNILSLLIQPRDEFSARMLMADSIDPGDGSDTNSSGGWTNSAQYTPLVFSTNDLWLEVPTNSLSVADQFSVFLHNTVENEFYDVLTTTNLSLPLNQWRVEQAILGIAGGITTSSLFVNDRMNLFVYAHLEETADGSLPNWWQLQYFGQTGIDPLSDPDGDGLNNYQEFLGGTNPLVADNYGISLTEPKPGLNLP